MASATTRTVDISTGSKVIAFEAEIEDSTGLAFGRLSFANTEDPESQSQYLSLDLSAGTSRVKREGQKETHISLLTIPASTSQGKWELAGVQLTDKTGNDIYLNKTYGWDEKSDTYTYHWTQEQRQSLSAIGITDPSLLSFSVTGSPQSSSDQLIDLETPILSSVKLYSNTANISSGNKVIAFEADIEDSTGFAFGRLSFANTEDPESQSQYLSLDLSAGTSRIKREGQKETHISLLTIPASTSQGKWELAGVQLTDKAGNDIYLNKTYAWDETSDTYTYHWTQEQRQSLSAIGITDPSLLSFSVTGSPQSSSDQLIDLETPILSSVKLYSNTANISSGNKVIAFEADIEDSTGFAFGRLSFANTEGPESQSQYLSLDLSAGTSRIKREGQKETHISLLTIPASTSQGKWELAGIQLTDKAGNDIYLNKTYGWDETSDTYTYHWTQEQRQSLSAIGITDPSLLSFSVTGSPQSSSDQAIDLETPRIVKSTFTNQPYQPPASLPKIDVSNGAKEITLDLDIKDLGLGVGSSYDEDSY